MGGRSRELEQTLTLLTIERIIVASVQTFVIHCRISSEVGTARKESNSSKHTTSQTEIHEEEEEVMKVCR